MSHMLRAFLVLSSLQSWLSLCTQAHMQMSWPYPLRSPLDPAVPIALRDYDITFPLAPDGNDFPCKHYQYNSTNPQAYDIKAVYQAGSTYNMTLAGTVMHMGGSCQISLSYDNGATFKVIESMIGGCPLTTTYNFTIPSFAPSSNTVLLSWSWFNLIGNREMYQNCARVGVQGNPVQHYRRTAYKRQVSLDELPDMFACNVGNGCTTIERREVVFPNPGNNVIYGQDESTPDPGPGFTLTATPSGNAFSTIVGRSPTSNILQITSAPFPMSNGSFPVAPTGTGTGYSNYTTTTLTTTLTNSNRLSTTALTRSFFPPSSFTTRTIASSITPISTTSSSMSTDSPSVVTITVTITVTPSPASTTGVSQRVTTPYATLRTIVTTILPINDVDSTSSSVASATPALSSRTTPSSPVATSTLTLPCNPGQFACNSPSTFSQCVSRGVGTTSYIYMGSVAAGMQCVNGVIIRQNDGPCTPNGQIFCKGGGSFYMCDQGGLINMGPVAPGTVCQNGVVVAA